MTEEGIPFGGRYRFCRDENESGVYWVTDERTGQTYRMGRKGSRIEGVAWPSGRKMTLPEAFKMLAYGAAAYLRLLLGRDL